MRFTVPASALAPSAARHRLEEVLQDDERLDDILLATSELVSNAVIHGELDEGDPIHLQIRRRGGQVRVGVTHRGPHLRRPPRIDVGVGPGGRGFTILEQVADSWDVQHRHGLTHVWFET